MSQLDGLFTPINNMQFVPLNWVDRSFNIIQTQGKWAGGRPWLFLLWFSPFLSSSLSPSNPNLFRKRVFISISAQGSRKCTLSRINYSDWRGASGFTCARTCCLRIVTSHGVSGLASSHHVAYYCCWRWWWWWWWSGSNALYLSLALFGSAIEIITLYIKRTALELGEEV